MGIIVPKTQEVTLWKGLHLFHFGMSNCSQRVRIMLEEKQLQWTSRYIDIPKDENLTDWYQGINPNGVVPTLVHDGKVIIESTDILKYLDKLFPSSGPHPSLMSGDGIDEHQQDQLISLANSAQIHIKTMSFEYLFKPMAKKNDRQLETLENKLRNKELLKFHKKFSSKGGLAQETIWYSICTIHQNLKALDERLMDSDWLAGNRFSITDIAWIVNLHRLQLMHFPIHNYPRLTPWINRMKERPSYKNALDKYEPSAALGAARLYSWFRAHVGRYAFKRAVC